MNHGSRLCKIRGRQIMGVRAQTFHKGRLYWEIKYMWTSWFFSKQFFKHEKNCRLPKCTSDTSRLCKIDKIKHPLFMPSLLLFGFLRDPSPPPPRSQSFCADVRSAPGSPTSLSPTPPRATLALPRTSTRSPPHKHSLSSADKSQCFIPSPSSLPHDITILTSQLGILESPAVPSSFLTHSTCGQSSQRASCVCALTPFLSPWGYPGPQVPGQDCPCLQSCHPPHCLQEEGMT